MSPSSVPVIRFRGGIVDHTVELVRRLHSDGLLSEHAAWSAPVPAAPPSGRPATCVGVTSDPSALQCARRATSVGGTHPAGCAWDGGWGRDAELLLLVVWSPLQLPAVAAVARSFRAASRGIAWRGPARPAMGPPDRPQRPARTSVHVPDVPLMRRLLPTADAVVVHSAAEAALARRLGAREPRVAALPLHAPDGMVKGAHPAGARPPGRARALSASSARTRVSRTSSARSR